MVSQFQQERYKSLSLDNPNPASTLICINVAVSTVIDSFNCQTMLCFYF